MSHARRDPMSLEAFLAWERAQEFRWEFDGEGPVAMTGGTLIHRALADALGRMLRARLPAGCRSLAGDVKIIAAGRVRYPDLVVICGPVDLSRDIAPDPVLVVEVLSPSTARTDRFLKLEEYRRTPSIQHYLLLEQASRDGLLFSRLDERFVARAVTAGDVLALSALGVELDMAEVYTEAGWDEDGPATGDEDG